MMPCPAPLVVVLALALALSHALPDKEVPDAQKEVSPGRDGGRLQKRAAASSSDTNQEELAALKDLFLSRLAADLEGSWQDIPSFKRDLLKAEIEGEANDEGDRREDMKKKRMFAPLAGLSGNLRTIKRQIRYHQCYFNPISCFRRK